MTDFFPPDIKVLLKGDKKLAQELMGEARNMFFKATLLKSTEPSMPVQLTRYLEGGGYISVVLIDTVKIVTINVPPIPVPEVQPEEPLVSATSLYMLSGVEKDGGEIIIGGASYLRSYAPTPASQISHDAPTGYNDNKKLGGSGHQRKASMFSGTMKRVVGAIEGLGKITDSSFYLTKPTHPTRVVMNQYSPGVFTTHGAWKSVSGDWWLVEVSADRGVLAMPFPRFDRTKGRGYKQWVTKNGDTGSAAVVEEFGGIPSGETFPTGTKLDDAIAASKVLQLMTASDLDSFYKAVPGESHDFFYGWAFPDGGVGGTVEAVRFNYYKKSGDALFSINGELFKITIDLPKIIPGTILSGTASIKLEHSGKISKTACQNFWASGEDEQLSNPLLTFSHLPIEDEFYPTVGENLAHGFGAYMHVFYRGAIVEYVKYVPYGFLSSGYYTVILSTTALAYNFTINPNTGEYDESFYDVVEDYYVGLCGTLAYVGLKVQGQTWSPSAFTSSSFDPRHINSSYTGIPTVPDAHSSLTAPVYHGLDAPGAYECIIPTGFEEGLAALDTQDGTIETNDNYYGKYIAIIPGYTRDGVILIETVAEVFAIADTGIPHTPGKQTATGVFSGFIEDIPITDNFRKYYSVSDTLRYGIVVAPGPEIAYIHTKEITRHTPTTADVSPGYSGRNVPDGTFPAIDLNQHTFIGSYTRKEILP